MANQEQPIAPVADQAPTPQAFPATVAPPLIVTDEDKAEAHSLGYLASEMTMLEWLAAHRRQKREAYSIIAEREKALHRIDGLYQKLLLDCAREIERRENADAKLEPLKRVAGNLESETERLYSRAEAAEAALAALKAESQWTPLTDRKPQAYVRVELLCEDTPWQGEYGTEFNYLTPKAWRLPALPSPPTTEATTPKV
jgi:hypothetical protein